MDTAAAAAAAAAAHTAKLLRVPLWQHALKASVIIGVAVAGAVVMARLLHEEADKAEAGEVSHMMATSYELICDSLYALGQLMHEEATKAEVGKIHHHVSLLI